MDDLIARIEQDFKEALKNKEELKVSVYRLIKAAFIHKTKETGQPLSQEEATLALRKLAKQHRESIEAYKKATRKDLVEQEESQLQVVSLYLPKALTDEEIETAVQDILLQWPVGKARDFGCVMGEAMKQLQGHADGAAVSKTVRGLL